MARIASVATLDAASAWLCRRRRDCRARADLLARIPKNLYRAYFRGFRPLGHPFPDGVHRTAALTRNFLNFMFSLGVSSGFRKCGTAALRRRKSHVKSWNRCQTHARRGGKARQSRRSPRHSQISQLIFLSSGFSIRGDQVSAISTVAPDDSVSADPIAGSAPRTAPAPAEFPLVRTAANLRVTSRSPDAGTAPRGLQALQRMAPLTVRRARDRHRGSGPDPMHGLQDARVRVFEQTCPAMPAPRARLG